MLFLSLLRLVKVLLLERPQLFSWLLDSDSLDYQASDYSVGCLLHFGNIELLFYWGVIQNNLSMDSRETPTDEFQEKVYPTIATALVRAVHEWWLIFMLFIDAGFSYLVIRFARYYRLQIPCLLCSRLDCVLGNERVGFYWDLICHKHKLKISSLLLCHLHDNLVDVHGTCESCFFSFATINKSNAETYRLLVGKLGAEPQYGLDQGSLSWEHNLGSTDTRKCSCCNEKLISTSYAKKLIQTKSTNSEEAEIDAPLSKPSAPNRDELKDIKDASSTFHHLGKNDADPLSRVEYSKINVTSNSESETPFSDDESGRALIREMESPDKDLAAEYVQSEPRVIACADNDDADPLAHVKYAKINITSDIESETPSSDDESACALIRKLESSHKDVAAEYVQPEPPIISLADNPDPEELINPASSTKLSLLESEVQLEANNSCCNTRSESPIGHHGLEELNRQQANHKNDGLVPSELITFDEILQLPKVSGNERYESKETDAKAMTELEREVTLEGGETTGLKVTPHQQMMTNSLDLSDAYKLAVGNKGRQLSGRLLEQQRSMKDSERASAEVKLLLSQISSRGIDPSLNDMSPRVSANSDDFKTFGASKAIGMQISLERNESNISLDGSTVSEIEGETLIDRLTRQVEHDKKVIGALYKELEEERNAASVAANQAMAMITRLQEEKAALYTEALQCLRMTEEQAEYEGEALQKANNLLAEKEKEIQDLEAELELHKNKLGGISSLGQFVMPSPESGAGELKVAQLDSNRKEFINTSCHSSNDDKFDVINRIVKALKLFGNVDYNTSVEVEDEKQYILRCLKQLEVKLNSFSKNEVYSEMTEGDYSTEEGSGVSNSKELDYREVY